jgi:hypothetical protein
MPGVKKSTAASLPLSASFIRRQEFSPCTTRQELRREMHVAEIEKMARWSHT